MKPRPAREAYSMPQLLRVLISAFVTAACLHLSAAATAQPSADPVAKQIPLTEKQVLGFIAAQKDMAPILEKIQGPANSRPRSTPPPRSTASRISMTMTR